MTRRLVLILTALLGVAGVVLTSASAASAQIPFFFDIAALLQSIFDSFPPFLQSFLGPLFAALLDAFTGSCEPFCAS